MTTNVLQAIVTAYCYCKLCCGPHATGLTAAGHKPRQGQSIAVPRRFPLGSTTIIGNTRFIADDRTARRFDGRFDIYMRNHREALNFGKQKLTVTIITP